jgi:hypothetical protein
VTAGNEVRVVAQPLLISLSPGFTGEREKDSSLRER